MLLRVLTDSSHRYVPNMEPYTGKDQFKTTNERGLTGIVKRLVEPFSKSGRNITTDRFYTSIELAERLYIEDGLSLVGTMNKTRIMIPGILKEKKRELHSSMFLFTPYPSIFPSVFTSITLVSYIASIRKPLIFLSTQHQTPTVHDKCNKITEINRYYIQTKGGVDVIDQMANMYLTRRGTRK